MYSYFKYIDMNLKKDITKGEDTLKTCVWFTLPAGVTSEVDKSTGEEVFTYEYVSFPCTARFGVEGDYIKFSTEAPYVYNISQIGHYDF